MSQSLIAIQSDITARVKSLRNVPLFVFSIIPLLLLTACSSVALIADQQALLSEKPGIEQWEIIRGGQNGNIYTGVSDFRLIRPVAVAARGDNIYIVDAGADKLYLYDRLLGRMTVIKDLREIVSGDVSDIFVAQDLSYYIADADAARVLHYDRFGELIRIFQDRINLARPVSVFEDPETGMVYIADAFNDDVLVYNPAGQLLGAIGTRGDELGEFRGIVAMAGGKDGIYVATRFGRHRVQVMNFDGSYRSAFSLDSVIFPSAIVVNGFGRAYVSDFMDDTIRVFVDGHVVETIGSSGSGPGQFKRISDLWLENGLLYVADSLNGRIQIIRVAATQ